jgi:putative glycosyltransferase (TIGR04348 family)
VKHDLLLVTPALADANNGNWQTARRWSQMLSADYRVRVSQAWDGEPADVLLALHARRSAVAVSAFAQACPGKPIVLALTGTDLYRDIQRDKSAQRALQAATRLIVLQPAGLGALPPRHRPKARVCEQSVALPAALRAPVAKPTDRLRAVMVGHLRAEKDPATAFAAARLLQHRMDIKLLHIGRSLEPALGQAAEALSIEDAAYGWLGELPHDEALAHIRQAHVLVHPSVMEGGAHAVIEAVRCGTPVLASRIPGNVGLLGDDYDGYFPVGDAAALADLLQRARDDTAFLRRLTRQCAAQSTRFSPRREKATLRGILAEAMVGSAAATGAA